MVLTKSDNNKDREYESDASLFDETEIYCCLLRIEVYFFILRLPLLHLRFISRLEIATRNLYKSHQATDLCSESKAFLPSIDNVIQPCIGLYIMMNIRKEILGQATCRRVSRCHTPTGNIGTRLARAQFG